MFSKKSNNKITPETKSAYDEVREKFSNDMPTELSSLAIKAGEWKFDYDKLSLEEIWKNIRNDRRGAWCATNFPGFDKFDVLELGPGEGYLSAALEEAGAKSVTSIEGNAENFLKCLLLKNILNLKTKYLYGDVSKYVSGTNKQFDMIFACGVLYHLIDPVQFIIDCGKISSRIYIWTTVYDDEILSLGGYQAECFSADDKREVKFGRERFTYHKRLYQPQTLRDSKYAGGMSAYSNWISKEDVFKAVHLAGYRLVQELDDEISGVPVVNYFGEKT